MQRTECFPRLQAMHALRASATAFAILLTACGPAQEAPTPVATESTPCVPGGQGFLRARLRGAIEADLDWQDGDMHCEGGLRPDGSGLRLAIVGPLKGSGRMLRLVFGIDTGSPEGHEAHAATNLTLIVEGAQRLYATLGDDKCTSDSLQRSDIGTGSGARQRVEVRGFCTGPAATMDGSDRVLVERFDFTTSYSTGSPP